MSSRVLTGRTSCTRLSAAGPSRSVERGEAVASGVDLRAPVPREQGSNGLVVAFEDIRPALCPGGRYVP
jgi:hypothetical protein